MTFHKWFLNISRILMVSCSLQPKIHSAKHMVVSTNNVLVVLISSEQCGFIFYLPFSLHGFVHGFWGHTTCIWCRHLHFFLQTYKNWKRMKSQNILKNVLVHSYYVCPIFLSTEPAMAIICELIYFFSWCFSEFAKRFLQNVQFAFVQTAHSLNHLKPFLQIDSLWNWQYQDYLKDKQR